MIKRKNSRSRIISVEGRVLHSMIKMTSKVARRKVNETFDEATDFLIS